MLAIKPIQTEAYGRLFRSRLEARCAVFLTEMGLRWEYEPEGYELPSGRYLPDFKVFDVKRLAGFYWLECKPGEPTDREVQLARELAQATQAAVGFFSTSLLDGYRKEYLKIKRFCDECSDRTDIPRREYSDDDDWWQPISAEKGVWQFWDRYSVVGAELTAKGFMDLYGAQPDWCLKELYPACTAALQARFEHGVSVDF